MARERLGHEFEIGVEHEPVQIGTQANALSEGHNIIALREGTRDDSQRLPRVLVHELLHCGLYEDRERRGQPHPRSLDPREEMEVQAMTDVVLRRLSEN